MSEPLRKALREAAVKLEFKGRLGESKGTLLAVPGGPRAALFTGLGPSGKLTMDRLDRLLRTWAATAADGTVVAMAPSLLRVRPDRGWPAALHLLSGSDRPYQDFLKNKRKQLACGLLAPEPMTPEEVDEALAEAAALHAGAEVARALGHTPGNILTPTAFARRVRELAKRYGWKVEVLGPAQLKKRKVPGLVMVGQGSGAPPPPPPPRPAPAPYPAARRLFSITRSCRWMSRSS
jgi:leucyl aminopeptidase